MSVQEQVLQGCYSDFQAWWCLLWDPHVVSLDASGFPMRAQHGRPLEGPAELRQCPPSEPRAGKGSGRGGDWRLGGLG